MYKSFLFLCAIVTLIAVSHETVAMTDPMQPPAYGNVKPVVAKTAVSRWQLTSTLIGQNRRLATINGKTLTVGKSINGAKIIDIQPAMVTLSYQNRSVVLTLLPTVVKRQRHQMTTE